MFILCLLSKSFSEVSPCSGSTLIPHRLVTKSVFWPASTLKPPPVFCHCQLPYHLLHRCRHRSANHPGTPTSCWDCPSTLVRSILVPPSRHHHPSIRSTFVIATIVQIFASALTSTLITSRAFLSPDTQWLVVHDSAGKSLP
jgi:hypothetical protein